MLPNNGDLVRVLTCLTQSQLVYVNQIGEVVSMLRESVNPVLLLRFSDGHEELFYTNQVKIEFSRL